MKTSLWRGREVVNQHVNPENPAVPWLRPILPCRSFVICNAEGAVAQDSF